MLRSFLNLKRKRLKEMLKVQCQPSSLTILTAARDQGLNSPHHIIISSSNVPCGFYARGPTLSSAEFGVHLAVSCFLDVGEISATRAPFFALLPTAQTPNLLLALCCKGERETPCPSSTGFRTTLDVKWKVSHQNYCASV